MNNGFSHLLNRFSIPGLRISLGLCFLWFGVLKFIPDCSPACEIAATTIQRLSFGLLSETVSIYSLAAFESLIGLSLIFKIKLNFSLWMLIGHLLFTFSTFIVVPEMVTGEKSFSLSIEGQYVIKNIVLIFAALTIFARTGQSHLRDEKSKKIPTELFDNQSLN